jgi:hypothetical protein
VKAPFKIVRETDKCFFTKHGRCLKSKIGHPTFMSTTAYPYVELVMIDASEETLREKLSQWFTDKAEQIKLQGGNENEY